MGGWGGLRKEIQISPWCLRFDCFERLNIYYSHSVLGIHFKKRPCILISGKRMVIHYTWPWYLMLKAIKLNVCTHHWTVQCASSMASTSSLVNNSYGRKIMISKETWSFMRAWRGEMTKIILEPRGRSWRIPATIGRLWYMKGLLEPVGKLTKMRDAVSKNALMLCPDR